MLGAHRLDRIGRITVWDSPQPRMSAAPGGTATNSVITTNCKQVVLYHILTGGSDSRVLVGNDGSGTPPKCSEKAGDSRIVTLSSRCFIVEYIFVVGCEPIERIRRDKAARQRSRSWSGGWWLRRAGRTYVYDTACRSGID